MHSANGHHAIIESTGLISQFSSVQIEDLLTKAAIAANSKILASNIHSFGDGYGCTGVLLLAESHISIHTWPEKNYSAIDIFICSGEENLNNAINVIRAADIDGELSVQTIERCPSI